MTAINAIANTHITGLWEKSIIPTLMEYIKIPNRSPLFDANWKSNGYMDAAVDLFIQWGKTHPLRGMQLEVLQLPNRTPLIYLEVPGQSDDTILLYGHLDKQPEMTGWEEDLGPWTPVLRGDRLYGRGSADDGYAFFSIISALSALQEQNIPHARCVALIEACEESGSQDLPAYLEYLQERIGKPTLVIGLDSGCGNYEQLWCTTSLRGIITGNLSVEILTEGVHSGNAGGIVPSSFRILRTLLNRLEDEKTGEILLPELNASIPLQRLEQAKQAASILGKTVYSEFPFVSNANPVTSDLPELILNRTWRPSLAITGAEGLPTLASAGNVLRPQTSVKIAMRVPPSCDVKIAAFAMKKVLEVDPPYHAKVEFIPDAFGQGWNAPPLQDWLEKAMNDASQAFFGKPCAYMGEGGAIPFMGMLGYMFPEAQFFISGVLGPHSNAHGPNEFLHIPTAQKLTACVASVIATQFSQN